MTGITNMGTSMACKFSVTGRYAVVYNGVNIRIYNSNNTFYHNYIGIAGDQIWSLDWNSDGTKIAFTVLYKGVKVLTISTKTVEDYYTVSNTTFLKSLDWSPDDQIIAFVILNSKIVFLNATTKAVIK